MMMRCLEAGGMTAVYGHEQDALNITGCDDYQPNPHGFYELDNEGEFLRSDFAQEYEGCLVKIPPNFAARLPDGDYRGVFMWREPAEILRSMTTFMPLHALRFEPAIWFYDLIVPALIERMRQVGAEMAVIRYGDVLRDPLAAFTSLDWPIDAARAASGVDPSLYRSLS